MEKKEIYKIVTNVKGRRILVVNQLLDVDRTPELHDADFDAIYINIAHRSYEENRLIARWTSPMRVNKCYLKPRFGTSSLEEFMHFAAYLFDGFCATPFDDKFTDYIEQIYNNIEKYGIHREISNDLQTTTKFLSNIVKYDISRGRITYTNCTIRGLSSGYTASYLVWYDNQETLQHDERMKFNIKMEELGFAEKSKFIEHIHVCPTCGHSHLLFMECCPRCNSSHIHEESMIHHFRCANVSPESTYEYDGELRCPKCKKALRHIGVDYDRPARVFTCYECDNTFIASTMRVVCSNCRSVTTPEKLTPVDVWEYKLTRTGLQAFATDNALLQIESKDIYSGYSQYSEFTNIIKTFPDMPGYIGYVLVIFRYEFNYDGASENYRLFDVMRAVISKMATIKITNRGDNLYLMVVAEADEANEEYIRVKQLIDQILLEYRVSHPGFSSKMLKSYIFEHTDRADTFIKSLTEKIIDEE